MEYKFLSEDCLEVRLSAPPADIKLIDMAVAAGDNAG